MQPQPIRLFRVVKMLWEDSACVDGWRHPQAEHVDVGTITSVGFVVGNNERGIAITTSFNDAKSPVSPISIPWSAVLECKEMEI